MPAKGSRKLLRNVGMLLMAAPLVAFTSPRSDDLVELKAELNGRSSAKFRNVDQNKIYQLKAGTRAIVQKVKYFDPKISGNTGNYGVCLKVQNIEELGPDKECVWIYYRPNDPNMKLYSVGKDPKKKTGKLEAWAKGAKNASLVRLSSPEKADAAQMTKPAAGVVQYVGVLADSKTAKSSGSKSSGKSGSASSGTDAGMAQSIAANMVQTVATLNSNADKLMDPSSSCVDCSRPNLKSAEQCTAKNDYMTDALKGLLNDQAYSTFFASPQKEIISTACVQRNMLNFSTSSQFYRQCAPGQRQDGKKVHRACVTDDYLNVTSKSFNLVADCMGDYVVGGFEGSASFLAGPATADAVLTKRQTDLENGKRQAALSVFAFMAQESGMHINAQSSTGAGGPGQMTGPAIDSVNKDLKNIRTHLQAKIHNPKCSAVLLHALEKPLVEDRAACDRKSPQNQIKAMAYAFAYQAYIRRHLEETVFEERLFGRVVAKDLPRTERDRLMMEVSAWAHNTGEGGMARPLAALLSIYKQHGKTIKTADDIDKFLKNLAPVVSRFNSKRPKETGNYYKNIQTKMKQITSGGRLSCLAN
ncbi:MAG: hypothetical protein ACXWC9_03155 [Pseudobdellovibrionaceae bacterium]